MENMTRDEYRSRLSGKKVGIAGCGGLGSNCALALARAGVGQLLLVDFDRVTEANLDRQFFFLDQVGLPKAPCLADNLARIDPGIVVEAREIRVGPALVADLFGGCDVVVEAFDAAAEKAMLMETMLLRLPDTWLVAASGLAGYGRSGTLKLRQMGKLVIVGDCESEVGPDNPPMAPRVAIAANMEANAVVAILLDGNPGEEA